MINKKEIENKENRYMNIVHLTNGDNLIEISVYSYKNLVYERTIKINAILDERLKCDFNFDMNVNLDDLIEFSHNLDRSVKSSSKDELYDLDSDGIININDFTLFNSNFGYTRQLN